VVVAVASLDHEMEILNLALSLSSELRGRELALRHRILPLRGRSSVGTARPIELSHPLLEVMTIAPSAGNFKVVGVGST